MGNSTFATCSHFGKQEYQEYNEFSMCLYIFSRVSCLALVSGNPRVTRFAVQQTKVLFRICCFCWFWVFFVVWVRVLKDSLFRKPLVWFSIAILWNESPQGPFLKKWPNKDQQMPKIPKRTTHRAKKSQKESHQKTNRFDLWGHRDTSPKWRKSREPFQNEYFHKCQNFRNTFFPTRDTFRYL